MPALSMGGRHKMPRIDDIRLRRGTLAEWTAANPVLNPGEVGLITDQKTFVVGDGELGFSSLEKWSDFRNGLGHILDGGHPANPYPATRNADDAEFNNSNQTENNTIGTHAGGDFWEWSPGSPATVNINTSYNSALYVSKIAGDTATDRTLVGNITSIGVDDSYKAEIVVYEQLARQVKKGRSVSIKFVDTNTNYYTRVAIEDDTTNGITLAGYYDNGSGDTSIFNTAIGSVDVPIAIGLQRYISGANANCRLFWELLSYPSSTYAVNARSIVSVSAKENFVPDEVHMLFHNGAYSEIWVIDSYRRT